MDKILRITFTLTCVIVGISALASDARHMFANGMLLTTIGLVYLPVQFSKPPNIIERCFTWCFSGALIFGMIPYIIASRFQDMCEAGFPLKIMGVWILGMTIISGVCILIIRLSDKSLRTEPKKDQNHKSINGHAAFMFLLMLVIGIISALTWQCGEADARSFAMFIISQAIFGIVFFFWFISNFIATQRYES